LVLQALTRKNTAIKKLYNSRYLAAFSACNVITALQVDLCNQGVLMPDVTNFLTVKQVAERLSMEPEQVRSWIAAGNLVSIQPTRPKRAGGERRGRHPHYINEAELQRFIAASLG
jgi:hypothetical protein